MDSAYGNRLKEYVDGSINNSCFTRSDGLNDHRYKWVGEAQTKGDKATMHKARNGIGVTCSKYRSMNREWKLGSTNRIQAQRYLDSE
jgi:hypothetical protein